MVYSALPIVARFFSVVCYTEVAICSSYLDGRRHASFKQNKMLSGDIFYLLNLIMFYIFETLRF